MAKADTRPYLAVAGLSRRDFLIRFHKPFQRAILFFAGPFVISLYLYWHLVHPSWHSTVLVAGSVLMVGCWYHGYRLAEKEKITRSVFFIVLPASIQPALTLLLLDGFEVACVWAMFAGAMYAGLLDHRPTYICLAIAVLAPVTGELVKYYKIIPMVSVPVEYRFVPIAGMTLLVGVFIVYFMIRSQSISGGMHRSLGIAGEEQRAVINTIQNILPEIENALRGIEQTSSTVGLQLSQLAIVTAHINSSMTSVNHEAALTAETASKTSSVAGNTHEIARRNSEHLRSVEVGFERGMKMISDAAQEVKSLASQMERIEEILDFNRQIGEQITLLAINATIEADGAGAYDKVFGDVAQEFKNMIQDTEQNLARSRALLHTVRDQARENALSISAGSAKLRRYYEELREIGNVVEENAERFYLTAAQLSEINESARKQQHHVRDVTGAIAEIDRATLDLSQSVAVLENNVTRIGKSGERLSEILEVESRQA